MTPDRAREELEAAARQCDDAAAIFDNGPVAELFERLRAAARSLDASSSRSWWGYQARCYWEGFEPARHPFDIEWGIHGPPWAGMNVEYAHPPDLWREYRDEDVRAEVFRRASVTGDEPLRAAAQHAAQTFAKEKADISTTLAALIAQREDETLSRVLRAVEGLEDHASLDSLLNAAAVVAPRGTRDRRVVGEGGVRTPPPHILVDCEVLTAGSYAGSLKGLAGLAREAALYVSKKAPAPPWDLLLLGSFLAGCLVGTYGVGGVALLRHGVGAILKDAPDDVRHLVVALVVAVLLSAIFVLPNLIADHIGKEGGILRAIVRQPRARFLVAALIGLTTLAVFLNLI